MLFIKSLFVISFLLYSCSSVQGVILKFGMEECIERDIKINEPFYGSYVSLPDNQGHYVNYNMIILSPSNEKLHESHALKDDYFNLVAKESGKYKFCLRAPHRNGYFPIRSVAWDLFVALHENDSDNMHFNDVHDLWHLVGQVDSELQKLRSTQQYLYWREKRHRMTVDSTNRRVLGYALLRSLIIVIVSVSQVFFLRRMFDRACASQYFR